MKGLRWEILKRIIEIDVEWTFFLLWKKGPEENFSQNLQWIIAVTLKSCWKYINFSFHKNCFYDEGWRTILFIKNFHSFIEKHFATTRQNADAHWIYWWKINVGFPKQFHTRIVRFLPFQTFANEFRRKLRNSHYGVCSSIKFGKFSL